MNDLCAMSNKVWILVAALLTGCHKEEGAGPNEPVPPVTRQMFADLGGLDPEQVGVIMSRPTQQDVPYLWRDAGDGTYVLIATVGGPIANVYRNDVLRFYGNVQQPVTFTYRLDNLVSVQVVLNPSDNGAAGYETILNW